MSKLKYWILSKFARRIISRHQPFIIGIIGSKKYRQASTSTIVKLLRDNFGTDNVQSSSNYRGRFIFLNPIFLGVSLSLSWPFRILNLYSVKSYPKYLLLEFNDDSELRRFMSIGKIDFLILAKECSCDTASFLETNFYRICSPAAKLFVPKDEAEALKSLSPIVIGVECKDCDFNAKNLDAGKRMYRIVTQGQNIALKTDRFEEESVYGQLTAFAIGHELNIQSLKIKKSLENS